MDNRRQDRLPLLKKVAYAAPAYALAVVGIPVYVYIPKFYTDVVGINVAVLGYLLFAVRIFDAVTDPAIGYISDHTRLSSGRRRPFMVMGAPLIALSMWALFNPPSGFAYPTLWFTLSIFALFFFWTVVTVPYESLGPEITFDYQERVSLFGMRDGFLMAGTLAAAGSPALIQWIFSLSSDGRAQRDTFFWLSVLYAPLIVAAAWWCVYMIKERRSVPSAASAGVLSGLKQLSRNRPFLILLAAYTISAIGNNLPATLILYYVEYVLQSDLANAFLMLYFITGVVFLPAWIAIARKIGKKRAWLSAMAINTGAFVGVFFLGPGDQVLYGILVFLSGIGFGATLAIPSAIQADVIDYDELLTGQRREGHYVGLWSISKKLAAAVGIGVGLAVLGIAGYTPNVVQTEQVQLVLRTMYALVPSVFNLIGFLIALAYPIDRHLHRQIRSAIAERNAGRPFQDPLDSKGIGTACAACT